LHVLEISDIHQSEKSVIQTKAHGGVIQVETKDGVGGVYYSVACLMIANADA
jgi:hypothetical protein